MTVDEISLVIDRVEDMAKQIGALTSERDALARIVDDEQTRRHSVEAGSRDLELEQLKRISSEADARAGLTWHRATDDDGKPYIPAGSIPHVLVRRPSGRVDAMFGDSPANIWRNVIDPDDYWAEFSPPDADCADCAADHTHGATQ